MNELQVLNHEQTISSREVAEMMEVRHADLMKKVEKHTEILEKVTERNFSLSDLWQLSSYKDSTGRTLKEYQVTKKGCEFLAHKTTGERGDIFTIRYMNRFEEMEQYIKAQTGLKVIDDAHIQTILNAVETQQQEIEEIKSLIGLRSKEVYNYGNQIKKHLGINKISDNPQDYENIKNMFFYELGGYTKWEQIPYSRDNIKLLQEICNDYKPHKTPLWDKYNG
jgi:phage regulator Rha-like protein